MGAYAIHKDQWLFDGKQEDAILHLFTEVSPAWL